MVCFENILTLGMDLLVFAIDSASLFCSSVKNFHIGGNGPKTVEDVLFDYLKILNALRNAIQYHKMNLQHKIFYSDFKLRMCWILIYRISVLPDIRNFKKLDTR